MNADDTDQESIYLETEFIKISKELYRSVFESQGQYFYRLSKVDPDITTEDVLNPEKSISQGLLLQKYATMKDKRLLEVGSGFAVNHIVWTRKFGIDGYGIEPGDEGFQSSLKISRQLVRDNGLLPDRIVNAVGENIPFEDDHFDLVYSTNVLEHTQDPGKVLREIVRVLKPGGTAQIVFPNYRSFYDGHYNIFHPPIFSNRFFQWLVSTIYRRDPYFASTIRTELNPSWCIENLRSFVKAGQVEVLDMGQAVFTERMTHIDFSHWQVLLKLEPYFRFGNLIGLNWLAAKLVILLSAWTPVILTFRKLDLRSGIEDTEMNDPG